MQRDLRNGEEALRGALREAGLEIATEQDELFAELLKQRNEAMMRKNMMNSGNLPTRWRERGEASPPKPTYRSTPESHT